MNNPRPLHAVAAVRPPYAEQGLRKARPQPARARSVGPSGVAVGILCGGEVPARRGTESVPSGSAWCLLITSRPRERPPLGACWFEVNK